MNIKNKNEEKKGSVAVALCGNLVHQMFNQIGSSGGCQFK